MKPTINSIWRLTFTLFVNIAVLLLLAHSIVTARNILDPTTYYRMSNFKLLLLVTFIFLAAYLVVVQRSMLLWRRWKMPLKALPVQALFALMLIVPATSIILAFAAFIYSMLGTTLRASGYLSLEIYLFVAAFLLLFIATVRFPYFNPWLSAPEPLASVAQDDPGPPVDAGHPSEDEAKQEHVAFAYGDQILHLPLGELILLVCLHKKCLAICREGRVLHTQKLNSRDLEQYPEAGTLVQINRSTFVQAKWVEGYTHGEVKYVVFKTHWQNIVDKVLQEQEEHGEVWKTNEVIQKKHLKISRNYLHQLEAIWDG